MARQSGMSFSSAEEFAQYLASSPGESPLGDMDPNKNKDASPETPSRTGKLASFISSVQAMSPTLSPQSSARTSRSPSEYSICSLEADEHPVSEFLDVQLITEDGTQIVHIGTSDVVHDEVRRLLRDKTCTCKIRDDCKIQIQYAGNHIEEGQTFEERHISENAKLDVFLIPKRFTGTIQAEGSLGLTLFIRHDAQTGHTSGVELGEVCGAALEAGFMGHDVLIEVDGVDISKKTFQEVQGIFLDVKSRQSEDNSSWEGLVLTVDRAYTAEELDEEKSGDDPDIDEEERNKDD